MSGKKFRNSLFGFNKSDVCDYIRDMDERIEVRLKDKESEVAELKAKIDELEAQRNTIVDVLRNAEVNAKSIVEDAKKNADSIMQNVDKEAEEKKQRLNRELEVKRREIQNYYDSENDKLSKIREDVKNLRKASIDAIRKFEEALAEIEGSAVTKHNSAQTMTQNSPVPFTDAQRPISVRTIKILKD